MNELERILSVLPELMALLPFIAFWVVVHSLISVLSGWWNVAIFYKAERPFSGQKFRFQSANMRVWMSYGNCLIIGSDPTGLYISIFSPFRIAHPPLFIPWEDISGKPARVFWINKVELCFEKCPEIPFTLSKRLAKKIERASGMILLDEEST
jgi:hypothetical protein